MVMDCEVSDQKKFREIIHKGGQMENLHDSQLANHLGINILLFTPAGNLVLPLRSKKVSYSPSKYSASISGAVSAHDVSAGQPLIQLSIIQEGIEELGLERTDIVNDSITFLRLTKRVNKRRETRAILHNANHIDNGRNTGKMVKSKRQMGKQNTRIPPFRKFHS